MPKIDKVLFNDMNNLISKLASLKTQNPLLEKIKRHLNHTDNLENGLAFDDFKKITYPVVISRSVKMDLTTSQFKIHKDIEPTLSNITNNEIMSMIMINCIENIKFLINIVFAHTEESYNTHSNYWMTCDKLKI
jgi:hypothetical protein